MTKTKKKQVALIIISIVVAALIFGLLTLWFIPRKIISNTEDISAARVIYNGSEVAFDENELIDILDKYNCRKTFTNYFPYENDEIEFEIDLIDNHKPKHILLGDFNIWYESADSGAYEILDAQVLTNELVNLFK